jgi:hypothetical protein
MDTAPSGLWHLSPSYRRTAADQNQIDIGQVPAIIAADSNHIGVPLLLTKQPARYVLFRHLREGLASERKNKFPPAVIDQSRQKEGSDESITKKVYIDNRALLAFALSCQDAHREVNRQFQQSRSEERTQAR